jgi:glycosyltransferase involved in cell wall biosynthesis
MKTMREMGMQVVYDLDDDLWGIPATNPAKKIFDDMKKGFGACMELCDVVTVSTEGLRTAVRTSVPGIKSKRVEVIENGIDYNYLRPSPIPKDPDRVVVGWGGSNTHLGDIGSAWSVLPGLLEELPNMHLEFVGMYPPQSLAKHPRVRLRAFVPVGEFASRFASWNWDIVLAPLDDNRFNRSKSNIKILEASAIGAVCLVSPVAPYSNFCSLNPELKWLQCYGKKDWRDKIRDLVMDRELRVDMAAKIRRTAEEHFEQGKQSQKWMRLFESMLQ